MSLGMLFGVGHDTRSQNEIQCGMQKQNGKSTLYTGIQCMGFDYLVYYTQALQREED